MNGSQQDRELPELSNDQIETLYQICVSASRSASPPIKALFTGYDVYVEEQGLDPGHENALFRWICAIGDSTRQQHKSGQTIGLVRGLRSVLAAQGIETILEDDEEDETRSLRVSYTPPKKRDSKPDRRVSFNDAHVEETWLSEHTESLHPPVAPSPNGLLSQPPRRGRDAKDAPHRARSTSSSHIHQPRLGAVEHQQGIFSGHHQHTELEHLRDPTLILDVSQTELEQNAEVFCATSEWRTARRLLHVWHDQTLARQTRRAQAWTFAVNHDRRKLLKESFDTLLGVYQDRRLKHERVLQVARWEEEQQARQLELEADLERRLLQYKRQRNEHYIWKAFSNWYESLQYQRRCRELAKASILKVRYFKRWRKLAAENAAKARTILTKKYLMIWRANAARHGMAYQQAEAQYEESLLRRYVQRWFWDFCSHRVQEWREQRLQRKAFDLWTTKLHNHWSRDVEAAHFRSGKLLRSTIGTLSRRADELQLASQTAESLSRRNLMLRCFDALQLRAKFTPAEKTLTARVDLDLKRKALKFWHLHLTLNIQAVELDRKRVLQSAWTNWNDALRCKALAQRVDERVQVEALYKWTLQARLKSFQRARDSGLVHRTLSTWVAKIQNMAATLSQVENDCRNNQRWRLLRFGMTSLNRSLRQREDAARAAVEFANSRALPDVLDVWKKRSAHARMLAKWAGDARFYVLATRSLKVWRERTEQQKHQRRRDAYAQIRSRIKIRIVSQCLSRWRSKNAEIQVLNKEAYLRKRARLYEIGTNTFDRLRVETAQYTELAVKAQAMDHQKLLGSALSALVSEHADLQILDQQAVLFRHETDLALLAGALKRMQWVTFTAARRAESADALWARNRDQHIKHMLRHWASQAATRQVSKADQQDGAESPSIRPASRLTARSAEKPSSPTIATPAYMRTPSRTRRAGRFKPLPTPAHVTPFGLDSSFLVTTPRPLVGSRPDPDEEHAEGTDIFETLTPQITPFARKLRAGGIGATPARVPQSALRGSVFGRSIGLGGTAKSVRFAGSKRFGGGLGTHSSAGESS